MTIISNLLRRFRRKSIAKIKIPLKHIPSTTIILRETLFVKKYISRMKNVPRVKRLKKPYTTIKAT